ASGAVLGEGGSEAGPWSGFAQCVASERFLEGAQVNLVCPRRALLTIHMPVRVGNCFDSKQTILAALLDRFGAAAAQAVTVDAAIDHDVCDVNAERAIFARHALRNHAQPGFSGGELGDAGLATQASRCAGEEHRAAAKRHEAACCFASHQKATETSHPPEMFEQLRGQLSEVEPAVVASVIDDQ